MALAAGLPVLLPVVAVLLLGVSAQSVPMGVIGFIVMGAGGYWVSERWAAHVHAQRPVSGSRK